MATNTQNHKMMCMSLVITRNDYCNSILADLPAFRLVPLQRVQNAAAPLVLNLDRRAHISPAPQQLHWLPVKQRVTFKIATLMHQILQKRCPSYLADLVTFNTTYSQRRQLRFSTTRSAAVRRTRSLPILRLVISTVIQLSDVHKSHLSTAVLFPRNCYPV